MLVLQSIFQPAVVPAFFRDAMAKLGWVDGRNVRIDFRASDGDADRFRIYAVELVSLTPDVIVTSSVAATRAVQQETQTIPIVTAGVGDPIVNGIVKNLARPEGNTTGTTNLFSSIGGKWLQLLKELTPTVERVALVYNARVTPDDNLYGYFPSINEAALAAAVQTIKIPYRDAVDLVRAIDAFGAQPNGGLIVVPPAPTPANREAILRLAAQYRLPTVWQAKQFVAEGGLISYGSNPDDVFARAAYFVDRIFRGTKVNELAFEYPTKFELAINLKTAKALSLTVPPNMLALADEVIE
jgi:putative ABC transport system substrate-binding protein